MDVSDKVLYLGLGAVGGLTLGYLLARAYAPKLKERIINEVTQEAAVNVRVAIPGIDQAIDLTPLLRTQVAVPVANGVMRGLYLG